MDPVPACFEGCCHRRLATITLNGTLDRVIRVPQLALGEIHDARDVVISAGGKGLNVARTARALGYEVVATGLVAGRCGEWICDLVVQEGMVERFIRMPRGESRTSTILVDPAARLSTVIHDSGVEAAEEDWARLRLLLGQTVEGCPWVALCGSSPAGLPGTVYADLCTDLQARGQRVCLDARDRWLIGALPARPYLVKCNQHEAGRVLSQAVDTPEQARDAAREWLTAGVERAVITLGAMGAVAVSEREAWYVPAPPVEALYPVGSGDAMLAGLIVALDGGADLVEALRYGVAVGAANTLLPGSGRCAVSAIPELWRQAAVMPI
jgi:tagatose 6-phosphate kinase